MQNNPNILKTIDNIHHALMIYSFLSMSPL